MSDTCYFLLCLLIGLVLVIVLGASYVPPWKLFSKPFDGKKILLLHFIFIGAMLWAGLLYNTQGLREALSSFADECRRFFGLL